MNEGDIPGNTVAAGVPANGGMGAAMLAAAKEYGVCCEVMLDALVIGLCFVSYIVDGCAFV